MSPTQVRSTRIPDKLPESSPIYVWSCSSFSGSTGDLWALGWRYLTNWDTTSILIMTTVSWTYFGWWIFIPIKIGPHDLRERSNGAARQVGSIALCNNCRFGALVMKKVFKKVEKVLFGFWSQNVRRTWNLKFIAWNLLLSYSSSCTASIDNWKLILKSSTKILSDF